jgi:circadian clock protein KaiC
VIGGLNRMLSGGIFESTSTLIAGMTGAGKTLTALSFLVAGARKKKPGLLVTMEESPMQIVRNSESFGWGVEELMAKGLIEIQHVSPSELDIDRHAAEIRQRADKQGSKVVVIDSISALETSAPSADKYRSYLWAINDHFKRTGVTTIMTAESARLFEAHEFAPQHVSLFADNIILLRSIEVEGENKRIISVPKMRGSPHDRFARELIIDAPKITVGPPFKQIGAGERTSDE